MIQKILALEDNMQKKISDHIEIQEMIGLLTNLDYDENLAYSLTSNLIDFFATYYSGAEALDEKVMYTFSRMFASDHSFIRDKVEKAILKLMIKNYRVIRKYLLLLLNDENLPEENRVLVEKLLQSAFSPIYFDYSHIADAKTELEEIMEPKKEG